MVQFDNYNRFQRTSDLLRVSFDSNGKEQVTPRTPAPKSDYPEVFGLKTQRKEGICFSDEGDREDQDLEEHDDKVEQLLHKELEIDLSDKYRREHSKEKFGTFNRSVWTQQPKKSKDVVESTQKFAYKHNRGLNNKASVKDLLTWM
eukprot:CAMPEP_0116938676 /NCGR_PEP_ID=MMETSP0467-20121206/32279_1 /TAXON_ID=283647 /ORGANISM="Mesodinium pulex, Strain SPMC105" /LENGTH=145 /DNA_ID=CAMNT_0004620803 /DNA_START=282 /DNA_END=722 /DNA_ORIENTATION=-